MDTEYLPRIKVVVPTFKRPHLLKVALESISKQTYKQYIDEIIVSENGLQRDSEKICSEFVDLNITYIFQEDQLNVLDHLAYLLSIFENEFVAMLCDDDWWHQNHVELAIKALSNTNAVAYFSNFTFLTDEKSWKTIKYTGLELLNVINGSFRNYCVNNLDTIDIYNISFLVTPFHFSAMFCKGRVLKDSIDLMRNANPTYADRLLFVKIATYGYVIFNPLPTSLIRQHQNMDSKNYSGSVWRKGLEDCSNQIAGIALCNGIDVKKNWNNAISSSNGEDLEILDYTLSYIYNEDKNAMEWYRRKDVVLNKIIEVHRPSWFNQTLIKILNRLIKVS